jgi:ribonuclease R
MAERRADEATRDVNNWLKCEYLQSRLGDTFDGVITSVTSFGFFVELDNLYAEGLVHVSQLGSDYFIFDAGKQRLIGERTRRTYRIGDKISVTISNVDLQERKVTLTPSDTAPKPQRHLAPGKPQQGKSPVSKKAADAAKSPSSGKPGKAGKARKSASSKPGKKSATPSAKKLPGKMPRKKR